MGSGIEKWVIMKSGKKESAVKIERPNQKFI